MKNLTTIFLLALLTAIMPALVIAEDGVICAAVQPCDTQYNLLDEYADATSACFDVYANRCLQEKITATSTALKFCEFDKQDLEGRLVNSDQDALIKSLKSKLKKTRRKLRRARR